MPGERRQDRLRREQIDEAQKGGERDNEGAEEGSLAAQRRFIGCGRKHLARFAQHLSLPSMLGVVPPRREEAERHFEAMGRLHIVWSFGSLSRSAESNTTVLLPVFFHQCETSLVSATTSPALCTIGTAQFDAYSLISPSMM
jgi:hypothetical protein